MTTASDVSRSWVKTAKSPVGSGTYTSETGSMFIDRTYQSNYRNLVKKGLFLPPLYYKRTLSQTSMNQVRSDTYDPNVDHSGNLVGISNITLGDMLSLGYLEKKPTGASYAEADVDSMAIQRFFSDCTHVKSEVGVTIAEAPKTFALIATTAIRIAKCYKYLKKLQVTKAMRELGYDSVNVRRSLNAKARLRKSKRNPSKFAAQSFLELQYGWKPLLAEVHNAAADLGARYQSTDKDVRVRGRANKKNHWDYRLVNPFPGTVGFPHGLHVWSIGSCFDTIQIEYGAYFQVVNPALRAKAAMGLTNPYSVIWELLPYSFVVDWFVPVGDYLASHNVTQGMTFKTGYKSVTRHNHYGIGMSGGADYNSRSSTTGRWFVLRGVLHYEVDSLFHERTVLTNVPANTKILRIKKLPDVFGIQHVSNALALLRSAFS